MAMKNVGYKLNRSDLERVVHSHLKFSTTDELFIAWQVTGMEESVDNTVGHFRPCIQRLGDE